MNLNDDQEEKAFDSIDEGETPEAQAMESEVGEPEMSELEMGEDSPAEVPGETEMPQTEMPQTKDCVFCCSEIHVVATRCPHCAGFLPIAEGTIFKQHFFFLFASLAMAIGCLLPWERSFVKFNLTGVDAIGGGFLFALAVYGMIVSVWNIYHKKMIVWPVMLAAIDGVVFGWQRVYQLINQMTAQLAGKDFSNHSAFEKFSYQAKEYAISIGPGLYLVTLFSTLVLLSVIVSVFKGAREDSARKAEDRDARAAARQARRTS